MFLLEGVAATGYLTFLADKFRREHNNDNARNIFKCSLWYLPLLLGLFVFHRKNGSQLGENEEKGLLDDVKVLLRRFCVHDAIISDQGKDLCPQVSAITPATTTP